MKKYIAILCLAISMLFLFSCSKEDPDAPHADTAPADWRNTIAYDGNVYINKETKLLYSLDKGKITLWDNAGDGSVFQTLNYDTYYDKAYDTVKFEDINLDGHKDITVVYSLKEGSELYNLWLWNSVDRSFSSVPLYKTVYNPVVSEDGKTVSGSRDMGMFGVLEMTYTLGEDLSFTQTGIDISNAEEIAKAISDEFSGGAPVEKTDGYITLNEAKCRVFAARKDGKIITYIAYTPDGEWYIDTNCSEAFRDLSASEGKYVLGSYADAAGEAFDRASAIYETRDLTITKITDGYMGENEAEAFTFMREGRIVCFLVKAENGVWYGTEDSLNRCCVVAASGSFEYVKGNTYKFTSIYEKLGTE